MKYLSLKSRLNERGQAALEYVLVLVVILTIAIAFSSRVIKPMGAFIQDVMGTYVSCLLETGELPKLGNEETKKNSCSAVYNSAFGSFKKGIKTGSFSRANSSSSSSSSSSRMNNADGTGSNSNKSKNANNQSGNNSGSSSGGGGSSYAGSSSRGGGNKIPNRRGASAGSDGAGSQYEFQDSKIKNVPQRQSNSKSNNSFNRNSSSSSSFGNQNKSVVISMQDLSEKDVAKLTGNTKSVKEISITGGESQSNAIKKKKITIKNRQSEIQAEDIEVEPIGFGDYGRYLLIAAIIIALVVFLGGQAFQMSKEM